MTEVELRHEWWAAAIPVVVTTLLIAVVWRLGIHWTLPRIAWASSIEACACFGAYAMTRDRIVAGPFGIEMLTWRGKTAFVWEDVARFHCDGKRLVLLGVDGRSLLEVSSGMYGDVPGFMRATTDLLRTREVTERRRDALLMTREQQHALDWVHRLWPVSLFALAGLEIAEAPFGGRAVLGTLLLVALGVGLLWLTHRESLTIGPRGLAIQGWIVRREVAWDAIASYRYSEDEDVLSPLSGIDNLEDLVVFVLKLVVWPIAYPVRALVRMLAFGRRSRRFYYGRLALLDANGKQIHEVTASSGFADIEDAFDRILDELAERQVTFAA
jgi:hypothetical protein